MLTSKLAVARPSECVVWQRGTCGARIMLRSLLQQTDPVMSLSLAVDLD